MIEEAGGQALAAKCDVSLTSDVVSTLEKTIETFGRFDYAFNNAGIEQPITPMADLKDAEWDRIVRLQVKLLTLPRSSASSV